MLISKLGNVRFGNSPFDKFQNKGAQNQEPKVNLNEQVQDKVDIKGKKINKGLIGAGILATIGIGIGLTVAIKKGTFIKLQAKMAENKAQKIAEKSKGVFEEAKNTIDEVKGLIEEGRANGFKDVASENGNIVRRFTDGVMEELDDAGKLIRKTTAENDYSNITSIEEFIGKSKRNGIEIENGEIYVLKGIEGSFDEPSKIAKSFYFNEDGTINMYAKKMVPTKDGETAACKCFVWDDGSLKGFGKLKNYGDKGRIIKYSSDGSLEFGKVAGEKWKNVCFDENGVKREVNKSSWKNPKYYDEKGRNITKEVLEEEDAELMELLKEINEETNFEPA